MQTIMKKILPWINKHRKYFLSPKVKIVFGFLLIILIYKVYITSSFNAPPPMPAKIVEVIQVKPQTLAKYITLMGTVRAQQSSRLVAKSGGVFQKMCEVGGRVVKGQKIARIVNESAQTNYDLAEKAQKIARDQYDRVVSLQLKGAASQQMVEEKKSALIMTQTSFENARVAFEKTVFLAPFDGIVGTFLVNDGSEIQENTMVVMVYDLSSHVVEFDIPAPLLLEIHDKPTVKIEGVEYQLTHVQKIVDENTHMSPAKVKVNNPKAIIGTQTEVELCVQKKDNILVLPDKAIFLENAKPYVYCVKNNKVLLTLIEVGLKYQDKVEVVKGISASDLIVVENPTRLQDGISVTIYNEPKIIKQ